MVTVDNFKTSSLDLSEIVNVNSCEVKVLRPPLGSTNRGLTVKWSYK